MKIHHFSTYSFGGAAIAAKRLHLGLIRRNINSRFHYLLDGQNQNVLPNSHQLEATPIIQNISWLNPLRGQLEKFRNRRIRDNYDHHIANRPLGFETFSMAEQLMAVTPSAKQLDVDILHLHWIAFLADYPSFFRKIPRHLPIVWTLHDMNPFTGGCHFSSGCQRFERSCGDCHQIENPSANDLSKANFQVKRKALADKKLHVVAPSRWMIDQAKRSSLWPDLTTFQHIAYGVDLKTLQPFEKRLAKTKLGLDPDSVTVGFGADNLNNPRKGIAHLEAALSGLAIPDHSLDALIFGGGNYDTKALKVHRATKLGFIDEGVKQALAYSACDFFVVPSIEDNSPQMALESMACGTPVVGFAVGGLSELIEDKITGRLVPKADEKALAQAIEWMVANPDSRRFMSQRARLVAMRAHDIEVQTSIHLELYHRLQAESKSASAA